MNGFIIAFPPFTAKLFPRFPFSWTKSHISYDFNWTYIFQMIFRNFAVREFKLFEISLCLCHVSWYFGHSHGLPSTNIWCKNIGEYEWNVFSVFQLIKPHSDDIEKTRSIQSVLCGICNIIRKNWNLENYSQGYLTLTQPHQFRWRVNKPISIWNRLLHFRKIVRVLGVIDNKMFRIWERIGSAAVIYIFRRFSMQYIRIFRYAMRK